MRAIITLYRFGFIVSQCECQACACCRVERLVQTLVENVAKSSHVDSSEQAPVFILAGTFTMKATEGTKSFHHATPEGVVLTVNQGDVLRESGEVPPPSIQKPLREQHEKHSLLQNLIEFGYPGPNKCVQ